jgi:DNA-binding response OmpR family regulator
MRILLVEDEPSAARFIAKGLREAGYAVDVAADGLAATEHAHQNDYDAIVLDVMLPRRDGLAVCRELRASGSDVPVLMLTARDAVEARVDGLDAGADDYLTKPFRLTELLARLRAHLRRRPAPVERTSIEVGILRLDLLARRAYLGPSEMELRPKEFDLLAVLAASAGQVISRDLLMTSVWDENWFGPTKTLDVHISWLRRKLVFKGEPVAHISTIRGRGYRFEIV